MLAYFQKKKDIGHLKGVKFGNDNEEKALTQFTEVTNYQLLKVGLVVPDKFWFLGVSPDGLIWNDSRSGFGIVEVKCLECDATDGKIVNRSELDENEQLKDTVGWYTQIQLTGWATKAEYAILFLYSGKPENCKVIEVELKKNWA